MQSCLLKLALGSFWVMALVVVAAGAQEAPARTSVASLPNPATIDGSGAERPRPAPDIRALIADPAIRNFIGLAENSYTLTDPNAVPGFEPMPLSHSSK